MIGTDISPEMLMQAREAADEREVSPLFLLQDLTKMDLYGTVMAITCCLDSLNYLENEKDLGKFFSLAHNYIEPGGLLIFDLNSRHKFEKVYADNCYVMQDDNVFLTWQNFYDEDTCDCQFVLDFFIKDKNGVTTIENAVAHSLITHIDYSQYGITTYFFDDYTESMFDNNQAKTFDSVFSYQYCIDTFDSILGAFLAQ
jgi:SAM-dependent methyltransferase